MTSIEQILALLERGPAMHEELARGLNRPVSTIRRATQELRIAGRISVDSYYASSPVFTLRKPSYTLES